MIKKTPAIFAFTLLISACLLIGCSSDNQGDFVCPPCDQSCDQLSFNEAGKCPHCHMELIHRDELTMEELVLNQIIFKQGSGAFLIEGADFRPEATIKVYYHQPQNYSADSPIVLVIPGAGRNADSYRDAWIEKSEQYGVFIVAPMYDDEQYTFEDYHLGGLIKETNLDQSVQFSDTSNQVFLDESQWQATLNHNRDQWLFQDFDRIFQLTKAALGNNQERYDLFGHSAGGHILHRLVLFHDSPFVNRILASNASFYTLPDDQTTFPFGLKGTDLNQANLSRSFAQKLVVFLGAQDNDQEKGGTFLRSETADKQGLHRLARGKHFFNSARTLSDSLAIEFNWQLHIVPNVGHNQALMAQAAADLLYANQQP